MSPKLQNLMSNQRFAWVVALCVFVVCVLLGEMFVSIQEREANIKRNIETVSYASTLRSRVERELNALLFLNSGLGSYLVVRNDSLQGKEVNDILAVLYRSSQHVRNFGVAVGYRLTYVHPLEGNQSAVGLYYPDQPKQWPMIQKIVASKKPALAGPIALVQGGNGLIYRAPLFIGGKYWGLLSTVIDADSLFQSIFEQTTDGNFVFALRSKEVMGIEDKAILGDQSLFARPGGVVQDIDIPGGRWVLAVQARRNNFLLDMTTAQRMVSVLLGGLIAWLLYLLMCHRTELSRLVMFDTLTGLPNRRLLQDRYRMVVARHQRHPQQLCALLFLDLDGFKKINDDHGHKAGDAVLQETAQRVRTLVRANDTVARWGGDEFVLLIDNMTQTHLNTLMVRLREAVEVPIDFEGHSLVVGASIGVAVYPEKGAELEDLLKIADQNMYHDKAQRKARQPT